MQLINSSQGNDVAETQPLISLSAYTERDQDNLFIITLKSTEYNLELYFHVRAGVMLL